MTEKQERFIRGLMDERVLEDELLARLTRTLEDETIEAKRASKIIAWLLEQPKRPVLVSNREDLPDVPAGRYAIDEDGVLRFFRIDRPEQGKWAGWTFVKQQSADGFMRVRGERAHAVLDAIAVDPLGAAVRYGRELGVCGCCGAQLTDEKSRQLGIGPRCAKKRGWALPAAA